MLYILVASYLKGREINKPSLNVVGIPPGDQASLLQSSKFPGCMGASRDHLIEAKLQSCGVFMGPLVLR